MRIDAPTADVLEAPEMRRYLDDTVRVWLGLARHVDSPRLPDELARLFLRLEEHESARRDRWGCWDFEYSENFRSGRLREAEIDRWLAKQRAELGGVALWPDGRSFAVCVTHDVDLVSNEATPRQIARHARAGAAAIGAEGDALPRRLARPPVRVARSLRRLSRAPSTQETLERSVELEVQRGIRASYLFTVPPLDVRSRWDCAYAPDDLCTFRSARCRIADVMQLLADEGSDVGLHGSYQAGNTPGLLARERDVLRRATGLEIVSTRQHFLHWDVRWTAQLQEAAGLCTDSSLGFNRNVGYRAGTSLPFHQFDLSERRSLELLEMPLIVQDGGLLGEIGIGEDADGAQRAVRQMFDEAAKTGAAVTVDFHPDKLARPDWLALFTWTLDHALERGAWTGSLRDLDEWWRARESRLLGPADD